MTDEQDKLVREIQDLQFEIDEYTRSINKRKIILERKEQQLKEMNDTQRNTNEAVENKRKEHLVSDLQSKNWYVNMREFIYPQLEVIDENTVKIEGVEYKKVEKPKPQTLYEIIREWNDNEYCPTCEELVNRIGSEWLPNDDPHDGEEYQLGWNACLEYLRKKLK